MRLESKSHKGPSLPAPNKKQQSVVGIRHLDSQIRLHKFKSLIYHLGLGSSVALGTLLNFSVPIKQ